MPAYRSELGVQTRSETGGTGNVQEYRLAPDALLTFCRAVIVHSPAWQAAASRELTA